MRLTEADVRFRTKPIPRLGLAAANAWNGPGGQAWTLTLRTEHVPLCLIAVSIQFVMGANEMEYFHSFNREIIVPTDSFQHYFQIQLPRFP